MLGVSSRGVVVQVITIQRGMHYGPGSKLDFGHSGGVAQGVGPGFRESQALFRALASARGDVRKACSRQIARRTAAKASLKVGFGLAYQAVVVTRWRSCIGSGIKVYKTRRSPLDSS